MNTPINQSPPGQPSQPGQQSAFAGNKPLWAAVGILGIAVLGMGATLISTQRAAAPAPTVAAISAPLTAPAQSAVPSSANTFTAADDLIEKPVAAPAKPVSPPTPAPRKVVRAAPEPTYTSPSPAPTRVAAAPVCAVCGSVESVTAVERSGKPDGVGIGTVAGGVLGAVLGNQVGHGNGRTVATILGAVGGGYAGNAIEGRVRKVTVYEVAVRMENGSRRVVEVAQPPSVGSRVTVNGSTLSAQ